MNEPEAHQLVDHLFRDRAGQMVAWLTRVFGPSHLERAEGVVAGCARQGAPAVAVLGHPRQSLRDIRT